MDTPLMPGAPSRATLQSTTGRIAAVATALLLVLFLVLSVSRAALIADTTNPGNTADTEGTVTLTNSDNATAMFSATEGELLPLPLGLDPVALADALDLSARCIQVRYDGDFATLPIQMYVTPLTGNPTLGDLAEHLDVTVHMKQIPVDAEIAVQEDTNSCLVYEGVAGLGEEIFVGKLDGFGLTPGAGQTTFAGAQGLYTFKITVNVENNPAAAQKSAAWNFVWEAHTAV